MNIIITDLLTTAEIRAYIDYAKRLNATTMHLTGRSVSLYNHNDCICEDYVPTREELRI